MASDDPRTQVSLDTWFPKKSGIREQIESICEKHPHGFTRSTEHQKMEGAEELDLMAQKLERSIILKRAVLKVNAVRCWSSLTGASQDNVKKKKIGSIGKYLVLKKKI
mmetsp:Transcript_14296/g.21816  ORF Transcript_14296/g.21816 Transcript_14296/m.21816 type:complete len:108 (+) Transcript_14296:2-325(+)